MSHSAGPRWHSTTPSLSHLLCPALLCQFYDTAIFWRYTPVQWCIVHTCTAKRIDKRFDLFFCNVSVENWCGGKPLLSMSRAPQPKAWPLPPVPAANSWQVMDDKGECQSAVSTVNCDPSSPVPQLVLESGQLVLESGRWGRWATCNCPTCALWELLRFERLVIEECSLRELPRLSPGSA